MMTMPALGQEEPHKIATLADREVWLATFQDSEGNTLALMSEPKLAGSR